MTAVRHEDWVRICPPVKYAVGHGKACTCVVVGTPVMFDDGRVPALVAVRTP